MDNKPNVPAIHRWYPICVKVCNLHSDNMISITKKCKQIDVLR